jgi:Fic family protein
MSDLEKYINDNDALPPLIKAGLAHVQFETIHPFLDGNGRIGRLLIVLMLIDSAVLSTPIIYPSYYFKKHQFEYYRCLDAVRTEGDFEGWIAYYLRAIEASSADAYKRAKEIEGLEQELKQTFGNTQFDALLTLLFQYPIITAMQVATHLEKSYNTARALLDECVAAGIVSISLEQKRNKQYQFDAYLKLLEKEY